MSTHKWLAAVLAVVMALGLAGGVSAEGNTPDDPISLPDEAPVTAQLKGNRGGSFVYYAIAYPGDERVVTIRVNYAPGDQATLSAVGFNVYGPNGYLIGEGELAGAAKELVYSDDDASTWLVQLYNYGDGMTVGYTISVDGLPSTSEPITKPDVDDEEPQAPSGEALAESGKLLGSRAGAFDRYEIAYESDQDVELVMRYTPDDPTIRAGVGMTIYGPDGWSREATVRDGERAVTIANGPTGTYIVQIYNYIEDLEISYTLEE
jgi:hypothetical protein